MVFGTQWILEQIHDGLKKIQQWLGQESLEIPPDTTNSTPKQTKDNASRVFCSYQSKIFNPQLLKDD